MNVATSCEQLLNLGANVNYNPYYANMNPGWQGHPDSMNQPEPKNVEPKSREGYPQATWGTPAQNPYGGAMPYANPKPYEEAGVEETITKKTTVEAKIKQKEYHPIKEEMAYIEEKPVMGTEYYSDYHMPYPKKKYTMETEMEEVSTKHKLTCENLPLATTYVRPQTYQGINSPADALKQGTAFSELYRPYTPKKTTKGGHYRHESYE